MNERVLEALKSGGIADITTIGRKSGLPRRIEIYFHHFDGEFFLAGRPGRKRDWLANLKANPDFTLHLKREVVADLAARATPITDPEERGRILYRALTESWDSDPDRAREALPRWVESSPLARFEIV